jgi:hypothetical protein
MVKADRATLRTLRFLMMVVVMRSICMLMTLLVLMRRMDTIETEHPRQQQHERDQNSEARFAQQPVDAA